MINEMQAFKFKCSGKRELVPLPPRKKTIGFRRVYSIKVRPNGEVDHLKAIPKSMGLTTVMLYL